MNFDLIGENIKSLRKERGMSQVQLSKGICTQAQLSRIENGDVYPLSTTLYLISERLGVNINYLLELGETERLDYAFEVRGLVRQLIRERNYTEVYEIVKSEKNSPAFQSKKHQKFLEWHEGICLYHVTKNKELALSTIQNAISYNTMAEQDIEMVNSLGIIHFDEKDYKKADSYFTQALSYYQRIPMPEDITIIIRILYNYARSLTRQSLYEISINQCQKAVNLCVQRESMYLLGELYYHIGFNLSHSDRQKSLQFMEKSLLIFELEKKDELSQLVKNKIKEISNSNSN